MAKYLPSAFARSRFALLSALALAACGTSVTPPVITGIDPNPAKPGSEITITGEFFGNPVATDGSGGIRPGFSLTIGGVALVFEMNNPNSEVRSWDGDNNIIVAVVPKDLKGTTVSVVVSTDAGSSIEYPLLLGESDDSAVVQPVIGWVLHDTQPMATLFQATAAGLPTVAESWTFSTSSFPDELSDATPVALWDFDFGANWEVTLNDVSASLEQSIAYLSISALDVTAGVSAHFLRPFEGFMLENADGDLPTGLGPVRLGDWGPVVALGIGDQTVSHVDSEAGTIAAIDYVELFDANFIALGVYGGIDDATDQPYTMLVGNTKLEGTAKMVVLWKQPAEGDTFTDQVLTIENDNTRQWVLNGMVTGADWNSWLVARKVEDCPEGNVFAECTGPDYIVKVRYRGHATEGTNFDASLVEFVGTVQMPDGVELRGIAKSQSTLFLPYASRTSAENGDGVYMLQGERANGFENVLADLLDGATVSIPNPGGSAVTTTTSDPITDTLQFVDPFDGPMASFDVSAPAQLQIGEHGAVSIDHDAAFNAMGYTYANEIRVSIVGGVLAATPDPIINPAAPAYRPASHDGPALFVTGATEFIYGALDYFYSPLNHTVYFMPTEPSSGTVTVTVDIGYRGTIYDNGCNCYIPDPASPYQVADTGVFEITVPVPTIKVPAAADLKKADGSAIVADPRDIYVIPETPLVLVSSHDENRVAVINSLQIDPADMWMHSFPSYAEGPTMLSCGVIKPAEAAK